MKRVCLLLALCLVLTLAGCAAEPAESAPVSRPDVPQTDAPQGVTVFSLAYNHDDTLDPFATQSEANLQLAGLLYDSLVVMGEGFLPQLSLASSVDTPDPTHVVAALRSAVFSDGSAVTPQDVVASFQRAKESVNYKALLANVASAAVTDGKVTFTLLAPDVNGLACLSFPVAKASTFTKEAAKAPVGSGRYVYQTGNGGATLTAAKGVEASYPTVQLRHLPNSTAMYYAFAGGNITYYYSDLDSGELPQRTGASMSVPANGLVFLGINGKKEHLKEAKVRCALSMLLDRSAIVNAAYSGWAKASRQPFSAAWKGFAAAEAAVPGRDVNGAVSLLDEAKVKPAKDGKRLALELVYCTERTDRGAVAEQIRTQLEGGGVEVTLTGLSEKEYLARLQKGDYDLYVGEIRLTADMSLRPLLTAGGSAAYGVDVNGAAAVAYGGYLRGEVTQQAFVETFTADMPYIPLCWREGFAAYDRQLTVVTPLGTDPYFGLAGWK